MEIQLLESQGNGRAFVRGDKGTLAEMTWIPGGDDHIVIDHTRVDESLRGTGTGKKLLDAIVTVASQRGLKIKPVCPFVVAMFRKYSEYGGISLPEGSGQSG
ncbi:MAG: N-acetyltransferase [Lentimicrobium sp.]|uniref:GNAT family N-acetyltransferase n=1 Tax=Lentimicrobium sp. TaxID=2034841 RepID=UPI0025FE3218|nr:GNAT family N-acetyltransferase [Lentimicrobium sp.]MCO5255718.1 N-acetyltransferase [Lentimicrobium sp.]HPF63843.1 GNAT family N-acetyltransferase [Lentimicrobium sp.]HPJ63040.1 GNAT family N-acetyltransferase [Lentimicrobium sp.]HRW70012.1 GNAT family N-acetyltransferase [Lentimicrobium sp.]